MVSDKSRGGASVRLAIIIGLLLCAIFYVAAERFDIATVTAANDEKAYIVIDTCTGHTWYFD
jgi:hypothetical protein